MTANTGPSDNEALSAREHFEQICGTAVEPKAESSDRVASRALARYLAGKCKGGALVDIGCGTGAFAHEATAYFVVSAFDPNRQVVRLVPTSVSWKWVGTGGAIPLRSNSVDLVTCLDVVEHLSNPEECILETCRVLKPGGLLLVRTPNPYSFGFRLKGRKWFGYRDPTHVSIGSIEDWKARFEKGGLVIIEVGTDLLWDPPYLSALDNRAEKTFFQLTNLIAMHVKPYLPWAGGENAYLLARKS